MVITMNQTPIWQKGQDVTARVVYQMSLTCILLAPFCVWSSWFRALETGEDNHMAGTDVPRQQPAAMCMNLVPQEASYYLK